MMPCLFRLLAILVLAYSTVVALFLSVNENRIVGNNNNNNNSGGGGLFSFSVVGLPLLATAFSVGFSVADTVTPTHKFRTLTSNRNRNRNTPLHQTTSTTTTTATTNDNQAPVPFPERVSVAIIGGGLGGLAVCAALHCRGVDAHVFEAAPTLLRGSTGTGIMISQNGFDAFNSIDPALPDKMRAKGSNIERQTITMSTPFGEIDKEMSFNMSSTNEQCNIGWSRAQEILASILPTTTASVVHCNARFESYQLEEEKKGTADTIDDDITVTFADGRSIHTSLLIGVDGINSNVRKFMAHHTTNDKNKKKRQQQQQQQAEATYQAQFSGQLLWNAIIPTRDIEPALAAHKPGQVELINCGIDGQVVLAFDAGEEQTSWYLTLMEHDLRQEDSTTGTGTRYGEEMQAIRAALDDGTFGGFGRAGVREQLTQAFAPWPRALACLKATPETQIFERRLEDRPPLLDWTGKSGGRVVLMGDAAHPMIPSQGQGTMMAWEDAADLAACVSPSILLLQQQLKEREDGEEGEEGKEVGDEKTTMTSLSKAIHSFVAQRSTRTARIQKMSADMYMGRKMSTFFPKKMLRMLQMKRQFTFLTEGYQPPPPPSIKTTTTTTTTTTNDGENTNNNNDDSDGDGDGDDENDDEGK